MEIQSQVVMVTLPFQQQHLQRAHLNKYIDCETITYILRSPCSTVSQNYVQGSYIRTALQHLMEVLCCLKEWLGCLIRCNCIYKFVHFFADGNSSQYVTISEKWPPESSQSNVTHKVRWIRKDWLKQETGSGNWWNLMGSRHVLNTNMEVWTMK